MASASQHVTIIVPTFNERDNLHALAQRLFATLDPAHTQLLVVDDNSPDGTSSEAQRLAQTFPLRCLTRTSERGLATAVIAGLAAAHTKLCVVMDADLSHPPESIPDLLAPLSDPAVEMVIGSRFVAGGRVDLHWPAHRRLNSWLGRILARPLTPVKDMMAGFFAVRRADIRLERLHPIGYKIALELIVRHNWRNVVEVPISFADRATGETKLNTAEQVRYLRHLTRLYAYVISGARRRATQ